MNNSKILTILKSFSSKELQTIRSFLESGLVYISNDEKNLFAALTENINAKLEKERLYNKIYPKDSFDDQKLRLLISRLFKGIEKYVAFSEMNTEDNKHINKLMLYRHYRKKHLKKLFGNYSQQNKSIENNIPLEIQLEMEFEDYQFNSLEKRDQKLNLQKLLDLTDKNFFIKKLRFACYAISHKAIYKAEYNFGMLDEILLTIERENLDEDPYIGLYYRCYKMIIDPNNDNLYKRYKDYLLKYDHLFMTEEKRSLYFFALNTCINKLNNGNKEYGLEGLEIYQKGIDNQVLFINGSLSRFTYRNMAMMAIRSNDFELAERMTKEHEPYLRKEDKENAFHFNMALINYYKKDLNNALNNIMRVQYKDLLISLATKTLQAKIYFELDQDKILGSHLDSMEMYLIRNKVSGSYRKNYKNFIKYTKKLVKVNPYNKEAKLKLRQLIIEEPLLTEKKWLLDQV